MIEIFLNCNKPKTGLRYCLLIAVLHIAGKHLFKNIQFELAIHLRIPYIATALVVLQRQFCI